MKNKQKVGIPYAGISNVFKSASLSCEAFWKIDAEEDMSCLLLTGGPRGGNSGGWNVGVPAFEVGFELVPERRPDDEPDAERALWVKWNPVLVLVTIRLDGRAPALLLGESNADALVKVNV